MATDSVEFKPTLFGVGFDVKKFVREILKGKELWTEIWVTKDRKDDLRLPWIAVDDLQALRHSLRYRLYTLRLICRRLEEELSGSNASVSTGKLLSDIKHQIDELYEIAERLKEITKPPPTRPDH